MTQRIVGAIVALAGVLILTRCVESTPDASVLGTSARSLQLETLDIASVAIQEFETILELASESDEPEYLFHQIKAGILTEAGFWIANGGSNELRYYSADGSFQLVLGGTGQGPGEFSALQDFLLLDPDTLIAFDRSGRATVFGPRREVLRTFEVPWFEDGLRATAYVGLGVREFAALVKRPRDPRGHLGETMRDSVELIVAAADGSGYRRTGTRLHDRWRTFSRATGAFVADSPPDGPSALLATLGSGLVTATSEDMELELWDAAFLDSATPANSTADPERRASDQVAPRAIDQLVGSDDGGLWVVLHPVDEGATVRSWIRLDSDAEVAARLEVPTNIWLLDVRGDRFLVGAADPQGNQGVRVLAAR